MSEPASRFFIDPSQATSEGLVGITAEITPEHLLQAYRHGVFPWSDHPARWFSPDPRAVFELPKITFSRRLGRLLRQNQFQVTYDTAFRAVMESCSRHHWDAWISPSMIDAYCRFHRQGYAHSVEVWRSQRLVGGLYGVQIGAMFAGESMFHHESGASKVAFAHLVGKLRALGVVLLDAQVLSGFTASLGAHEIPREEFLDRLEKALAANDAAVKWRV